MKTKISTSIEQSKKLIGLGLDVNTADMYYNVIDDSFKLYDDNAKLYINDGLNSDIDWKNIFSYDKILPAWSLSALIELMPEHIVINNKVSNSLKMDKEEGGVGFCYFFGAVDKVDDIIICDMTPLDAAYEIVCYLLENKLI